MSRFDRYILSQMLALFGFFSLVLVGVYWVNLAVGLSGALIGGGRSALSSLQVFLLIFPNAMRLVLPISAFVASVYITNRLISECELIVMQASGTSAFLLARPVLYFGLFVAAIMLVLSNFLVPASRVQLSQLNAEIAQSMGSRLLKDGQFLYPLDGITIYFRQIDPSGELIDLFLADDRDVRNRYIYTAPKAFLIGSDLEPRLLMFDGMVQLLEAPSSQLTVTRFQDFTYSLEGIMAPQTPKQRRIDELSTPELLSASDALLAETGKSQEALTFEAHSRIAQPILAVAAALIGFSSLLQGSYSRFGLWRQIMVAVAILLFVQATAIVTTGLGRSSPGVWCLAYVAPVLGLTLATLALWVSQMPRGGTVRGKLVEAIRPVA